MIPYERIVQWLAAPVSALIAFGATSLVHSDISKSQSLAVATFVLTTLAGIASHWKWLQNLAKWWDKSVATTGDTAYNPDEVEIELSGGVDNPTVAGAPSKDV